jgi:hypothetical protein
MPIHENWIVEDLDQLEQLVEDGTNSIASDNDELRFQLETSKYTLRICYIYNVTALLRIQCSTLVLLSWPKI